MMVNMLSGHGDPTGHTRVAVVVSNDVGFGMGRMVQMTIEATNAAISMRVFRTYDEAERWLTVGSQSSP